MKRIILLFWLLVLSVILSGCVQSNGSQSNLQWTEDGLCYNDEFTTKFQTNMYLDKKTIVLDSESEQKLYFAGESDREKYVKSLSELSCLEELNMDQVKGTMDFKDIGAVSWLGKLTNLKVLTISNTNISDISFVENLTELEWFGIIISPVSDITPLSKLKNLRRLHLGKTNVSDISELRGLTNLEILDLLETDVSNISPLSDLTNINSLTLSNTNVSNIDTLKNLNKLEFLILRNTKVSQSDCDSLKEALPNAEIQCSQDSPFS